MKIKIIVRCRYCTVSGPRLTRTVPSLHLRWPPLNIYVGCNKFSGLVNSGQKYYKPSASLPPQTWSSWGPPLEWRTVPVRSRHCSMLYRPELRNCINPRSVQSYSLLLLTHHCPGLHPLHWEPQQRLQLNVWLDQGAVRLSGAPGVLLPGGWHSHSLLARQNHHQG